MGTKHLDESWICISVRDTGVGIDADRLPHVFDRLFQVAAQPPPELGGVGIGLSLVRKLVLLMHGGLAVHSLPGQGTEFVISLPQTRQAPSGRYRDYGTDTDPGGWPGSDRIDGGAIRRQARSFTGRGQ